MKKSNKFVLGLALTAGVIGCFGTAFALYENKTNAEDKTITIGSTEGHADSSDKVTYKIGTMEFYKDEECSTNNKFAESDKLSPNLNKVYVKVPLSFEYSSDNKTVSPQDSVLGHLNVKVDVVEKIANLGTTVTAKLKGYNKGIGDSDASVETYFTANKMADFFLGDGGAQVDYKNLTESSGYRTRNASIDTAIDKNNIYCVVGINMSEALTADNFFKLAEISDAFKVTVNWSPYQTTAYANGETWRDENLIPTAYVRGDLSDWESKDDYQMVPNINGAYNIVEWEYRLLKGFTRIKVFDAKETECSTDGWIYCKGFKEGSGASILDNGDVKLDSTKYYKVYYKRNETTEGKKGFYVDSDSPDTTD